MSGYNLASCMQMTWFCVVSWKKFWIRRLKVNADKSKVTVLNGEEGLKFEVSVDGMSLKHVSEFKYLRCVLDESGTCNAECHRKVEKNSLFL